MNIKLTYDNEIPFCEGKNKTINKPQSIAPINISVVILIQITMKMNSLTNV